LAEVFAAQAAIAIENARLVNALRQAATELEARVEWRTQQRHGTVSVAFIDTGVGMNSDVGNNLFMEDIFGFLTVAQWLAILRIGIGLWWLKSVLHKPLKKFVSGQMTGWTVALAENHPIPAYGKLVKDLVAPNAAWFPYLILLGEFSVAVGMIFGFLTPISLLVAIFLNLNYIVLAGVRPKDITINKAYQCEQGQNWAMVISEVVLFVLVPLAGCTWSIDHALGLFCGA